MTEPTDAELIALLGDRQFSSIGAVREALRRWGTPPAVAGEPVATLHCNQDCYVWARATEAGKLLRFEEPMNLYTAPQPSQAQAGAVESEEFGQFLSDVLTAAGLVTHGKQCKALGERLADMCAKLRHHGIKGGQHGTDT